MSGSRFFNLFQSGFIAPAHPSLGSAQAAASPGEGAWLGTVEVRDDRAVSWYPAPPSTSATSNPTDAEIREALAVIRVALAVIRVARVLRGGAA